MNKINLAPQPDYDASYSDWWCLTLPIWLILLPIILIWIWLDGGFSKLDERRENAEENYRRISLRLSILADESKTPEEREKRLEKFHLINSYFYWFLYGGETPNSRYPKNFGKRVHKFFKQNNIDMWSKDFDVEYVLKCVEEQDF